MSSESAESGDPVRPVEIEGGDPIRPVENGVSSPEKSVEKGLEGLDGDSEVIFPDNLTEKVVSKVSEVRDKLVEACRDEAREIEASRVFTHPMKGKFKGWSAVVSLKVSLRRM